jgi:DNA N-6-adenine-methyltransferase (Dam)
MSQCGYHEPSVGETSEWYTPRSVLDRIGLVYDLDPCSPGHNVAHCCVPARLIYTIHDDGLRQPWRGLVFMNPPWGEGRNRIVRWLEKFFRHANGIAVCRAYTSSGWFHNIVVPNAELLLFPRGKTKFVRPTGEVGEAPGHGVIFLGVGEVACNALRRSGFGFCVVPDPTVHRPMWAPPIDLFANQETRS